MIEIRKEIRQAAHLALVAPTEPPPAMAAPEPASYLTTTRCRPSELPGLVSLTLDPEVLRGAGARARASGVELSTWVRLAIECARQASRAASLFSLPLSDVHALVDEAAAGPSRMQPIAVAPLAAYVRALHTGAGGRDAQPTPTAELLVHAPDELIVAWSSAASESGQRLDAWASAQIIAAPVHVLAWEVAAARRGFYLGEWILAVSASSSAKRSNARPHA